MQHSMSRADNGGENRLLLWQAAHGGAEPTVRFADVDNAFDRQTRLTGGRWPSGAADLDGDLLPELYFANDFGPDRLLHNRSTPGHAALRRGRGAADLHHAQLQGARPRLVQGHGRRLRRPQRRRHPRHLRQQHRRRVRARGEPLRLGEHGRRRHRCARASLRIPIRARPLGPVAQRLGLGRTPRRLRQRRRARGGAGHRLRARRDATAGPSCTSWPWATTTTCDHPGAWPRFQPGDDLSGHLHNPFFVRARDGRYYDVAPELGLDDNRRQPRHRHRRRRRRRRARLRRGQPVGAVVLLPQRQPRIRAPLLASGAAAAHVLERRADAPGRAAPRSPSSCRTAGAGWRRWTAAAATRASAAPRSTSASGP